MCVCVCEACVQADISDVEELGVGPDRTSPPQLRTHHTSSSVCVFVCVCVEGLTPGVSSGGSHSRLHLQVDAHDSFL